MAMELAPTGADGSVIGARIAGGVEYGLSPVRTVTTLLSLAGDGGASSQSHRSGDARAAGAPAGQGGAAADARARARDAAERGGELLDRHDFAAALPFFLEAVRLDASVGEYHFKLSCCAWRVDKFDLVEPHLLEAMKLQPGQPSVAEALALWYLLQGQIAKALEQSALALAGNPNHSDFIVTRASILAADGKDQQAWQLLEPLVAAGLTTRRVATAYAQIALRIGHEESAVALVQESLRRNDLAPADRAQLHFAASALLDKLKRYDEAFEEARRANELRARPYHAELNSRMTSRRIGYYTRERLHSLPRATHGSRRPVFIVGMPRSGTSLVEQILASHPAVFGAGELATISELARSVALAEWAEGIPFPECFDTLSMRRANALAAQYLQKLDSFDSNAIHVTDKMPTNFLYLGFIELLFPEAYVIHCLRNPRDTCLSCYFTDFAIGNEFSGNMPNLAAFHRDYARLMSHYKETLGIAMLDVRYEDLVSDPRAQTRRMLEFVELPWDERCMAFHENTRHVATASREQVRQPIYQKSIGRWKNYEKHLGEVLTLVAPDRPIVQ